MFPQLPLPIRRMKNSLYPFRSPTIWWSKFLSGLSVVRAAGRQGVSGQCWEPVGFPVCTEFLLSVVFEVCSALPSHLLLYLLHIAMQFTGALWSGKYANHLPQVCLLQWWFELWSGDHLPSLCQRTFQGEIGSSIVPTT